MQITGIKKDIIELKRLASLEKKQSKDDKIKNLTDAELQEEINQELAKMGFESEEEFLDAAKNFILEKDPQANVTHDYAIHKRIFELFEDCKLVEEFMLKYSSVELTE
jgi:hypothetical protein